GVRRIHREVGRAGGVVAEQDLGPRLAAVCGLVNPALGVWPERTALRGDVGDVGVCRMNTDARNLLRLGEADEGPGLTTIRRLEDAVAVGDVAADRVLACPHVDDVAIRFAHPDRADPA